MMHTDDPLETLIDETGDFWQVRSTYSAEGFFQIEGDTLLTEALRRWPSNDVASFSFACLLSIVPRLEDCIATVVEVGHTEDPTRFLVRQHRNENADFRGVNVRGKAIAEMPLNQRHATLCAIEYDECRRSGRPGFHQIDQQIDGLHRSYRRLILPLRDRRGGVAQLYVFSRKLTLPGAA